MFVKFAEKLIFEFNLKVIGFTVQPLDQPENSNPSAGVALTVTSVQAGR